MSDLEIEVTKDDEGTVRIEGLNASVAPFFRRRLEHVFDVTAELTISARELCVITLRGAGDEPLGDDETPLFYQMWLVGWWAGYCTRAHGPMFNE